MTTSRTELRTRVETNLSRLSNVGRRVALVLLDEHDRLGFYSATDIARMVDTSDATVIRTVQRLGYAGMVDLKASIAEQLEPPTPAQRLEATVDGSGPPHGHLREVLDTQHKALTRLTDPDVRDQIERSADRIRAARRVHVNARGVSVGIAAYAAGQLGRVGVDARVLGSAAGITADDLLALGARDAVLVVSSGQRQRWQHILYEACADVGVGIVLITDSQAGPDDSSIVIRVGRGDPFTAATHVATVATIEAITVDVAAKPGRRAESTLERLGDYRTRLAR